MTRSNPDPNQSTPNSRSGPAPYPEGWEELVAGYVLGNLSEEEQQTFAQLRQEYPALLSEVEAYSDSLNSLPLTLAGLSPSDDLEERILTIANPQATSLPTDTKGTVPQWTFTSPGERIRWWQWVGMAAAAGIGIALVANNRQLSYRLAQSENDNQQLQAQLEQVNNELVQYRQVEPHNQAILAALQQSNTLVYPLEGTGDAFEASGSLLAVPNRPEVALVSDNLSPLPEAKVYRLWAVSTPTSTPMYCGEFSDITAGMALWTVPDELCIDAPVQMILTVDEINDPPVPKGPAVLQSILAGS